MSRTACATIGNDAANRSKSFNTIASPPSVGTSMSERQCDCPSLGPLDVRLLSSQRLRSPMIPNRTDRQRVAFGVNAHERVEIRVIVRHRDHRPHSGEIDRGQNRTHLASQDSCRYRSRLYSCLLNLSLIHSCRRIVRMCPKYKNVLCLLRETEGLLKLAKGGLDGLPVRYGRGDRVRVDKGLDFGGLFDQLSHFRCCRLAVVDA